MKKSRKFSLIAAAVVVLAVAGMWGFSTLNGASAIIDPSRLATVESGTMVRSVVATGKIEPITKVEIKSKANGIIEKLLADVDHVVQAGQVLAELDKENLTARVREARANFQAAEAAHEAAIAQLNKNEIEAESPDLDFARRSHVRAQQLFNQKLVSQSALEEAKSGLDQAENRQRAARGQLVISRARVAEASANVAQARAAVERAEEELANATIKAPIRATVLTRDLEVGSPVSSILNLGANATLIMTLGDIDNVFVRGRVDEADIGRVRLGQQAKIPYVIVGKIRRKDQDSNYSGPDNDKLFIPYSTMARDFPRTDAQAGVVSQIILAPEPWVLDGLPQALNERTGRVQDIRWPLEREVRQILARRHGFDPADRDALALWDTSVQSLMFARMVQTMKDFFSIVGVVTLALGGLGVMNIMLVAVRERTREIGIRKALGATTGDIQRQFFLEGFLLTMISGAAGFAIALGLCALVNMLPMPTRFQGMILTWQAGTAAVATLMLIGVVTCTYPARRAAQLPPVEALRFES